MSENEKERAIIVEYGLLSHFPAKLNKEQKQEAETFLLNILGPYATSKENKPMYFPSEISSELKNVLNNVARNCDLIYENQTINEQKIIVIKKKPALLPFNLETSDKKGTSIKASDFIDVPDPIKGVWVNEVTSNSINLEWNPPDSNGKPIEKYLIEILSNNVPKIMLNSASPQILVSNLFPNSLYIFSIRAENSEGIGYKMENEFLCRTLADPHLVAGEIYSWGQINLNQLPFDIENDKPEISAECVLKPTFAKTLGNYVVDCCAYSSGAGILCDGTVFRFGKVYIHSEDADDAQKSKAYFIGDKNEKMSEIHCGPYQLIFPFKGKPAILQVCCGDLFGLALSTTGQVFSWGWNEHGELGIGDSFECFYGIEPFLVKFPKNTFIKQIAAGTNHALALTIKNEIFCWGKRQAYCPKEYIENIIEDTTAFIKQSEPRLIKSTDIEGIPKNIYAGGDTSGIINEKNELMMFGDNEMCQLGIGKKFNGFLHVPRKIDFFKKNQKVIKLSIGYAHTLALISDENNKTSVFSWGFNEKCQCGFKTKDDLVEFPTKIENAEEISEISAGLLHSLFLDKSGSIYVCGDASKGASGVASELKGKFSSLKKLAKIEGRKCIKINAGANTSYAIMNTI